MLSLLRALSESPRAAGLRLPHCALLLLASCAEDAAPNDAAQMSVVPNDTAPTSETPAGAGGTSGAPLTAPSLDEPPPGSTPAGVTAGPNASMPPVVMPVPDTPPPDPPTVTPTPEPLPPVNPVPDVTAPASNGGASPSPIGGAGPDVAAGGSGGVVDGGGGAPGAGGGGEPAPANICPASPGTAPSGTIAATLVPGVEPEDYNYHLFEGVAWLGDAVYFSDIDPNPWNSTIRKYVPATGMVSNFLVDAASNGLAVSSDGVLYSATAGKKQITRYSASGAEEVAVPGPFNSPNDLTIARDGTIYFTDPQQGELPAGNQPQVVHVVKGGVDDIFSEEITSPNGVALSPDGGTLYVSGGGFTGYLKKVTLVDGLAGEIEELATGLQVPDGLGVDCAGNVYVALHETQQVAVYAPSGSQIATITIGSAANGQAGKPTNVAFGGSERKTLFVSAAYSLWQVPLEIAGFPN